MKLHCEISLRWSDGQASGETDNVSERGVMLSLGDPPEPPLARGDVVRLTFSLPGVDAPCRVDAQVRWNSAVLPGVLGLEFVDELDHDAVTMLSLLADRAS